MNPRFFMTVQLRRGREHGSRPVGRYGRPHSRRRLDHRRNCGWWRALGPSWRPSRWGLSRALGKALAECLLLRKTERGTSGRPSPSLEGGPTNGFPLRPAAPFASAWSGWDPSGTGMGCLGFAQDVTVRKRDGGGVAEGTPHAQAPARIPAITSGRSSPMKSTMASPSSWPGRQ